jgi:hypothetical protein
VGVLAREVEALRDGLRSWAEMARWLWARRPPAPRLTAIAFVLGAAICGALAVLAQARLPGRLPSARDWTALRTLLEREARAGDAAVLSPHWAERAREVLPASLPVLAQRGYADEDLLGVRRLWLVSIPDAPGFSFDTEKEILGRAARAEAAGRVGAFEVARYDVAFPLLPLAFLPDRLAPAEVARGEAERQVREVAGAPRPCLVLRPGGGEPLTVDFAAVRVGRVVRGHVGAIGPASLAAPIRVAVVVDGEEAGAAELAGAGFAPFQVDTTRYAAAVRPMSLVLTTPGAPAEVCLDAVTLP